jgi:hypothetical protein
MFYSGREQKSLRKRVIAKHSFPDVRLVLTKQDKMYSKFHCGENETEIKQVKKFYEFQPMSFFYVIDCRLLENESFISWIVTSF